MIDEDPIMAVPMRETNVETTCQNLIRAALDAGGRDNVTVVLGDISFEEDEA